MTRSQIMKVYLVLASLFLLLVSFGAFAGWQVDAAGSAPPQEGPFFQPGTPVIGPMASNNVAFPNPYASLGQPAAVYAVSICGSLKENVERIMGRYNWRVVWKAPYDYNFDGRVTGSSLQNVIEKLLRPFPLQAVMYMSNRTLAVIPRERTKEEQ